MKKINENMIKIKNNTMSTKEYIDLYNIYRFFMTKYIIEKLKLKEYDKKIKNSKSNFLPIETDKMDVYQFFSCDELKYIYIRNNVYIERLSNKEINLLKDKLKNNDYSIDDSIEELIEKTYQKVIFEDIMKNGKKYQIMYGPDSSRFFARNDSLVLGIRYDEFAIINLTDEEWKIQNKKQREFLRNIINEMTKEFENKLNIPIKIIKYNDYSVNIKRTNE